ncbi:hypothetical protein [Dawidia soli]|uniref:Uncharacterized protein n=1 Tax=Dawidia soli TaxID=2782352 RepID=A0AAP2DAG7_9BACT|nr:hypothetical protein [Dawidia soli]MBT1688274.1 hypothetical protein [Dawidia soli]
MPYFIRIFGRTDVKISTSTIEETLIDANLPVVINIESRSGDDWKSINIGTRNGDDIVVIDKTTVIDDLGRSELEEFKQEIQNCNPKSAVRWITEFFSHVEVIYALQILDFSDQTTGWDVVTRIKTILWQMTEGIIQADYEGFTNEDGYHILWQFSADVTGDWYMAVLDPSNRWIRFKMDLGNDAHRAAFNKGQVPQGVETITDFL